MKTRSSLVLPLLLLAALFFALPPAGIAQDDQQYQNDQQYQQDQQDPPTRVAQLNYVEGSVSYQPAGEQDWVQADINRPLTTGDNLWADQNSRGELHIGSTALRIGDQTGISFLNLSDQAAQIQLAQGTMEIHVRRLHQDEAYEIDTPNLAFTIDRPGDYRLTTDPNGSSTIITTYSGEGTVTGGGQTFNVLPGQRAVFAGTNPLSENLERIGGEDSFDGWSRSREAREERSASLRYVSPEVTGYEDLDEYGSWRSDPDYGNYWVPSRVSADWEPYHEGHWCWVAPWGWTWVDNEPWGFAPFHYGRWAIIGGAWGWVPGPVAVAPVYAPALVGFVGGGGFGVAVGFGGGVGVGWFPLGPRDVYVPAYRVSERYVEVVNVSNTRVINRTTITNVYNNYTVNHVTNVNYTYAGNTRAVTVVNRDAFVSGRPVARSAMRVDSAELQHPRVVTNAQLTPSRASVIGPAATARAKPPASLENRRVVTKMTPAPQAGPIGHPRPSTNPNLSPAVLNRSGYSPQLQTVRATAASRTPARAAAPNEPNRPANTAANARAAEPNRSATAPNQPRPNETRPNETRPNATPNRPFTPPNRPATVPNQPRPNETRPNETRPYATPNRPFTPPNRPAENSRPNESRPNATPNRPFTPPNRPVENPNRATPPAEQPRPEARPRTVTPPPERQPSRPAEQPRPETRPPATERQPSRPVEQPRPQATPRTAPPAARPAARPAEKQPPPQQEKPKEKPKPQPQL